MTVDFQTTFVALGLLMSTFCHETFGKFRGRFEVTLGHFGYMNMALNHFWVTLGFSGSQHGHMMATLQVLRTLQGI